MSSSETEKKSTLMRSKICSRTRSEIPSNNGWREIKPEKNEGQGNSTTPTRTRPTATWLPARTLTAAACGTDKSTVRVRNELWIPSVSLSRRRTLTRICTYMATLAVPVVNIVPFGVARTQTDILSLCLGQHRSTIQPSEHLSSYICESCAERNRPRAIEPSRSAYRSRPLARPPINAFKWTARSPGASAGTTAASRRRACPP